jgi:hypothetical protein
MRDALPMALIKRNSLRESEGYCCVGASPAYHAGTTGLATPIQKMGGYYNKSLHRLSPLWSFAFNSNCKQACLLLNAKALAIAKAFVLSGRLDSNQRPLAPHASALPGCATSRSVPAYLSDSENLVELPAPGSLERPVFSKRAAKIGGSPQLSKQLHSIYNSKKFFFVSLQGISFCAKDYEVYIPKPYFVIFPLCGIFTRI